MSATEHSLLNRHVSSLLQHARAAALSPSTARAHAVLYLAGQQTALLTVYAMACVFHCCCVVARSLARPPACCNESPARCADGKCAHVRRRGGEGGVVGVQFRQQELDEASMDAKYPLTVSAKTPVKARKAA
jgi:hypothetical protein